MSNKVILSPTHAYRALYKLSCLTKIIIPTQQQQITGAQTHQQASASQWSINVSEIILSIHRLHHVLLTFIPTKTQVIDQKSLIGHTSHWSCSIFHQPTWRSPRLTRSQPLNCLTPGLQVTNFHTTSFALSHGYGCIIELIIGIYNIHMPHYAWPPPYLWGKASISSRQNMAKNDF